ncbi:MAG: nuclear transport factor 2 family protein [Pseudomonadota bacterium]
MTKSVKEIGDRLVALCKADDARTCLDELYDPAAVSVEPMAMPGAGSASLTGLDAIKGKHDWWENTFEIHDFEVEGPFPHGDDKFAVIFRIDATNTETGERDNSKEVGVYHVTDGKIVREEFFYSMGG